MASWAYLFSCLIILVWTDSELVARLRNAFVIFKAFCPLIESQPPIKWFNHWHCFSKSKCDHLSLSNRLTWVWPLAFCRSAAPRPLVQFMTNIRTEVFIATKPSDQLAFMCVQPPSIAQINTFLWRCNNVNHVNASHGWYRRPFVWRSITSSVRIARTEHSLECPKSHFIEVDKDQG